MRTATPRMRAVTFGSHPPAGVALGALGYDAAAGDLVTGEARDTALQLRALIATGVACDSAVGNAHFTQTYGLGNELRSFTCVRPPSIAKDT